jgi:hypothetical protein
MTHMLHLNSKNPKTKHHLSLTLRQQKHPWDIAAEKAKEKAKQYEQKEKTHKVSTRQYHKEIVSFNEEELSNQLSQILLPHQELKVEHNIDSDDQTLDETNGHTQGFFLCPSCTCWFTNEKDLNFHTKHWCRR